MANLAIRGHATRGDEVIALLEMLGGENRFQREGNNKDRFYYIDKNRHIQTTCGALSYTLFDLEQFEEEFPYKVGDKVCYQPNPQIDTTCMSKIVAMRWLNNSVIYTTSNVHELYACDLQPYKEETMEEINIGRIGFDGDNARLILPDGYEFKAEGNEVFVIKKKFKYPKTYEECCKIKQSDPNFYIDTHLYSNKLGLLYKLLICRDAYWKIAGEQMGLDKPWDSVYGCGEWGYWIGYDINENKIYCLGSRILLNHLLVFPTEEMRDAFYENFNDLIEQCKELL